MSYILKVKVKIIFSNKRVTHHTERSYIRIFDIKQKN